VNLKRWLFLAVLIGPLVVAFGALITGTLVWILWPLVVSVVLPGAIAAGVVAAKLPYFTAVGFCYLAGLIIGTANTKLHVKE
jgi:hypothetical protein